MRQPDVAGLLAPGAIVDLPGGELADMARALVCEGLADVASPRPTSTVCVPLWA